MRKWLLLLAAAVAVPTGNTEAQSWDVNSFLYVCVGGSLRACGSVIVKTRWTGTVTEVQVLVRNEQGSAVTNGAATAAYITTIGLTIPGLATPRGNLRGLDNFGVAIEEPVGQDGSPPPQDLWDFQNGNLGGQVAVKFGQKGPPASSTAGLDGGIKGCDQPYLTTNIFFTTCDTQGWVVFSFTTTTEFSANNAQIAMRFQSMGPTYDDPNLSLVCRPDDEGGEHACLVIPEPATYALLLTGLVGVLGMAWLRRKEDQTT